MIKFRRLNQPVQIVNGIKIQWWEIALDEDDLNAKLNGEMAEVIMPAEPWYIQLWYFFFPLCEVSGTIDEV